MKKRLISMLLVAAMLLTVLPLAAFAAEDGRPDGWWPALEAYENAKAAYDADKSSANEAAFLKAGDDYIKVLTSISRTQFTADNLYNIYNDRRTRNIFENKSDYTSAVDNIQKLLEVSQYLTGIGVDRKDMITVCQSRLKVLPPVTEVYAVSYTQNNAYGSKVAAGSGTYYGAVEGSANYNQRSITSFYVEMEETSIRDHAYRIEPYADGTRVILVNLNFKGTGATAKKVPSGTYDEKLRDGFSYLATVNSPVLLRIGGEMDNWGNTTPDEFIAAYKHIANLARSLCPKVELVWSPNFVADFNTSADIYYPGDSVVDWVGVSLYYNYATDNDTTAWIEYARKKQYADPVLVAENVLNIAIAHKKPFIVTEGGAIREASHDGTGIAWTAKKAAKEFSTLNMVYPQVKAIVYFDTQDPDNGNDYRIQGQVKTAVDQAVEENPALIQPGQTSAGTWIPAKDFNETAGGTVLFGAAGHTFKSADMSAVYKLDGVQTASTSGSPNHYALDTGALKAGKHKLEVTLSDGFGYSVTKTYTLTYSAGGSLRCSEGWTEGGYTATPFSDVPDSAYYVDAVNWAYDHEPQVTNGTGNGKFSPLDTVERGQAVTFLWRAMGEPAPETQVNPFTDVKESDYFYKAVLWAVEKGITNGTSSTKFSPKSPVERGQMVTFLWRTLGRPGDKGSATWYEDAVNWAQENHLLDGTAEAFSVSAKCPRSDVVTYLYRALTE